MEDSDALGFRIAAALHARESLSAAFGIRMDGAGEGWARASMRVSDDMLNGHAMAHGGAIFSLADTAFAWACNSRNETTVAQNASITFLSPAARGDDLIAEARERAGKGRSGVYDVTVTAADGRVVAVFQGLSRTVGGPVVE